MKNGWSKNAVCERLVATASARRGMAYSYQRPVDKNTLKRHGRVLRIVRGNQSVTLNGFGIHMLKTILRDCGEIGGRVNRRRTRVLAI